MKRLTTHEFISNAISIHGNKYDYSLVDYKSNKTKIKIICVDHGIFEQQPNNHITNKQTCPICSYNFNLLASKEQASTTEEFINKSKLIHGDKYDYSLVKYVNKKTKVKIICSKHGIFEQQPNYHLRRCGCQICNESKGELLIANQLVKHNIKFIKQKTFVNCKIKNELPFDFYLPDYNICIEYDGEQHFKPIKIFGGEERFIKQQLTDKVKNEYCNINKIKLFRISFKDNIKEKCYEIIKNW